MNLKKIVAITLATAITVSQTANIKSMQQAPASPGHSCYLHRLIKNFNMVQTMEEYTKIESEFVAALIWAERHNTILNELVSVNRNGDTALHLATKLNIPALVNILIYRYRTHNLLHVLDAVNKANEKPLDIVNKNRFAILQSHDITNEIKAIQLRNIDKITKVLRKFYTQHASMRGAVRDEVCEPADDESSTKAILDSDDDKPQISDEDMAAWFAKNTPHR